MTLVLTTVVRLQADQGLQWETLAGAGALLLGVILTGLWADKRQRQSLAADRDRFESQQSHDRQLADLAELRTLLDRAVEQFGTLETAALALMALQSWALKVGLEPDGVRQKFDASGEDFTLALSSVAGMTTRIALRVGWDHDLVAKHSTTMDGLRQALVKHAPRDGRVTQEAVEAQEEAHEIFKQDLFSFVHAARDFVASRLPEEAVAAGGSGV